MRLIKIDEKRNLALKAVVYGCNTNKRLVGSSFMTGIGSDSVETISFYDALNVIDEMMDDTIESEPVKHGRWVHCNGKSNLWYCSECGEKIMYNPTRRTYNIEKKPVHEVNKRCRNCGAKMDGGAGA